MNNNNHRILTLFNYQVALKASLGLFSLGTMIWVAVKLLLPCDSQYFICPELPWDVVPVLIGLGFWAVGLNMWFKQQEVLLVIFFFMVSSTLTSGLLSGFGDDAAGRIFYIVFVWLAPIILHAHLVWVKRTAGRMVRVTLHFFYGLAVAQFVPLVGWTVPELRTFGWFPIIRFTSRLTLVAAILVTATILAGYIRGCKIANVCSRVRMVFFGLVLGLAPLTLLSILPSLFGLPFIPSIYNFPWLIFMPLSYSYMVYRHRLVQIEGYLSRAIVYYLTSIFLVSSYLVAYGILERFVPGWRTSWIIAGGILGAVILLLVSPLRRIFRQWVAWFLNGSEKASLDLVSRMTNSLALVTDRETLCDQLINKLGSLLAVQGSLMFLGNETDGFLLQGVRGLPHWEHEAGILKVSGDNPLVLRLKSIAKPVETGSIREEIESTSTISPELVAELPAASLWLPLTSRDTMLGALVLSPGSNREYFTFEDRRVLSILARQVGITAHNVKLFDDVRKGQYELSHAHQQLLRVRDEERKYLARELHDQVIQILTGVGLRISTLKKMTEGDIRDQISEAQTLIGDSINRLRTLCTELRQPVLDNLGLAVAAQSLVEEFQRLTNSEIDFGIDDNPGEPLSEEITHCAYWVLQEALMNIQKHAKAQRVEIRLSITSFQLELDVTDDGLGFNVPINFDFLTRENHFGLAGSRERAEMIGGKLMISSTPHEGCHLSLRIPLDSRYTN